MASLERVTQSAGGDAYTENDAIHSAIVSNDPASLLKACLANIDVNAKFRSANVSHPGWSIDRKKQIDQYLLHPSESYSRQIILISHQKWIYWSSTHIKFQCTSAGASESYSLLKPITGFFIRDQIGTDRSIVSNSDELKLIQIHFCFRLMVLTADSAEIQALAQDFHAHILQPRWPYYGPFGHVY